MTVPRLPRHGRHTLKQLGPEQHPPRPKDTSNWPGTPSGPCMQILSANPEGSPAVTTQPLEIILKPPSFRPEKHQQGEGGAGFSKNKSSRQKTGCGQTVEAPPCTCS